MFDRTEINEQVALYTKIKELCKEKNYLITIKTKYGSETVFVTNMESELAYEHFIAKITAVSPQNVNVVHNYDISIIEDVE